MKLSKVLEEKAPVLILVEELLEYTIIHIRPSAKIVPNCDNSAYGKGTT